MSNLSRVLAPLAISLIAMAAACNKQAAQPVPTPAPPAQLPTAEATAAPAAPAPPRAAVIEAAPATPSVAITGFKHDPAYDVFGYYMPAVETKFGKWTLSNISIGTPDDLAKYEKGDRDPPEYAPVLIEFFDESSPQVENELGGSEHTGQLRVLPAAYSIADGKVIFAGDDPQVGHVTFSGTLDVAAVKRASAAMASGGSAEDGPVLTGDLTVGDKIARHITFTWFGGD